MEPGLTEAGKRSYSPVRHRGRSQPCSCLASHVPCWCSARFANLINASPVPTPEVVVDLFCGIGYFTLAALVHAAPDKLRHVYACDWNPEALQVTSSETASLACPEGSKQENRARDGRSAQQLGTGCRSDLFRTKETLLFGLTCCRLLGYAAVAQQLCSSRTAELQCGLFPAVDARSAPPLCAIRYSRGNLTVCFRRCCPVASRPRPVKARD